MSGEDHTHGREFRALLDVGRLGSILSFHHAGAGAEGLNQLLSG
jgi:hypothetical protein